MKYFEGKTVFTVPMRIETLSKEHLKAQGSLSFYSTYEELKQGTDVKLNCTYVSGFYSTYEELKHKSNIFKEPLPYYRFYSTYEELKLICCNIKWTSIRGFYSTYEELKLYKVALTRLWTFTFLQYLWGIETGGNFPLNLKFKSVFTVPMRNWNKGIDFNIKI